MSIIGLNTSILILSVSTSNKVSHSNQTWHYIWLIVTYPDSDADASVLMALETGLGGLSPRPFRARTTTKMVSEGPRSVMV